MKRFAGYNPSYLDRRIMEREARKNRPMIKSRGKRPATINHRLVCIILCNYGKSIEEIAELIGKTITQSHAYIQYLRSVGIAIPKRTGKVGRKVGYSSPKTAKAAIPTRLPEISPPAVPVARKTGQIVTRSNATGRPAVNNRVNPDVVAVKKEEGRFVWDAQKRGWILKKVAA